LPSSGKSSDATAAKMMPADRFCGARATAFTRVSRVSAGRAVRRADKRCSECSQACAPSRLKYSLGPRRNVHAQQQRATQQHRHRRHRASDGGKAHGVAVRIVRHSVRAVCCAPQPRAAARARASIARSTASDAGDGA
jgi:hypothetical protein